MPASLKHKYHLAYLVISLNGEIFGPLQQAYSCSDKQALSGSIEQYTVNKTALGTPLHLLKHSWTLK